MSIQLANSERNQTPKVLRKMTTLSAVKSSETVGQARAGYMHILQILVALPWKTAVDCIFVKTASVDTKWSRQNDVLVLPNTSFY